MRIIDTHTHIYSKEYDADRSEVIRRAKAAGVVAVLLPNEDSGSIEPINKLCDEEPNFAFPMIGLHPTSVDSNYIDEMKRIEAVISKRKYYAVGEIGIDLYWDRSFIKEQIIVFLEQLQWSIEMQMPISVHTRNSFNEVLDCIHRVGPDRLKGVFHCFGGTMDEWNEISELKNFYIGIGGVITFKNNNINAILKNIPIERIVPETDAPYLAPVPYRGKRNEPAYIFEVLKKTSECYKTTIEEVSNLLYKNAFDLFNIQTNNIEDKAF